MGYLRRHGKLTFFTGHPGICDNSTNTTPSLHSRCMTDFGVDAHGAPTVTERQLTIVDNNNANIPPQSTWYEISPLQMLDAGVIYAVPLRNTNGTAFGTASSVLFSANIDSFLISNFGNNTNNGDRVIFITNDKFSILGASVPNIDYKINEYGVAVSVNVQDCTNSIIRRAGLIVGNLPDSFHNFETLVVTHDLLIQQPVIERTGLSWHVISARLGTPAHDHPATDSISFTAVAVICVFLFLSLCVIGSIILRNHIRMRLWKYAQPYWLLLILFANVVCLLFACTLMVTPSHSNCVLQLWARTVALTLVSAGTLTKIHVMARAAVTHDFSLSPSVKRRIAVVWTLAGAQLLLTAVQTRYSNVDTSFADSNGSLVERMMCVNVNRRLGIAIDGIIVVLCWVSMLRGWKQRNVSKLCEESRGLFIAAVEGVVLCVAIIAIDRTTSTHTASLGLAWLKVGLVLWYVVTMSLFVFAPRLYRHFEIGDLTVTEMRMMLLTKTKAPPNRSASSASEVFETPNEKKFHILFPRGL
eukprot:c533_g1_i2.p1 GENE.c533_g1_i2~~c533_g1_i2.p1  ORF type:complete len:528 (-),score=153.39 c533_g1_i2:197-1780(-)